MNPLKNPLRILLTLLAALQLTACSKTVQWEEEVPVNTGETIWIKRHVEYERYGNNPLALGLTDWRPINQKLEFQWNKESYVFAERIGPMVLLIDPLTNEPRIVVPKPSESCTPPFYRALRFIDGLWVEDMKSLQIAWNQRRNLMLHTPGTPAKALLKYSSAQIIDLDSGYVPSQGYPPLTVDPAYVPSHCKTK